VLGQKGGDQIAYKESQGNEAPQILRRQLAGQPPNIECHVEWHFFAASVHGGNIGAQKGFVKEQMFISICTQCQYRSSQTPVLT